MRAPSATKAYVAATMVGGVMAAIGPVADLPIVNLDIAPDGFLRPTVLAGGTFPGPMIRGNKGDNFKINVIDELGQKGMDVTTSIHWHGIDQKQSVSMDGTAMMSQCPIVPGGSFEYNFNVSDQAGTFWYHSHLGAQYCDGLRGAMIVYDPNDPHADLYDVDDESTVITLADWYHYMSSEAPRIPAFNTTLINGLGRDPGTTANTSLAVINVVHGQRYRFRVIAMSCDPNFLFSVDRHQLTVIEADGSNVQPVVVDEMQILAGQRYSVVLNADQPVDNYWVRALPNVKNASYEGGRNAGVLRYAGADLFADPQTQKSGGQLPLLETNLHPLEKVVLPGKPYPGGADVNIALDTTFDYKTLKFLVNNVSFTSPDVPVLLQALSGAKRAQDLLPSGSIYGVKRNQSVEITMPGGVVGGPHPMHLHGQSFYVVRSAGNSTYNWVDPVYRDTVDIGDGNDLVTIRFMADNPGPWFIHCHIDWHLATGFAAVLAIEDPDIANEIPTPESWEQLCPSYTKYTQKM
uniref:Laccase 3 n=1 Tax=Amylostereum areolatum TaxID=103385 RepID=A0A873P8Q7_9AGAM|nr:laccase 3 [Amylostereum areolatum]